MSKKKTLLILSRWFVPGFRAGGMIRTIDSLTKQFSNELDIFVLTTNCDFGSELPYQEIEFDTWLTINSSQVMYLSKRQTNISKLREIIFEFSPDFIYLNGLFDPLFNLYPIWLKKRNRITSNLILAPSGMLAPSAIKHKSWKKRMFLTCFKQFGLQNILSWHVTSLHESEHVNNIMGDNLNVVTIPPFPPTVQIDFLKINKKTGHLKLLFLSRVHPIKNLKFIFEILKHCTSKIELNIAGPIEDEQYWNSCLQIGKSLPSSVSISFHGHIDHKNIATFIQRNHLFILPTKGENYGFSIIEALTYARPVLISDQTPWHNLKEHKAGWNISLTKLDEYISAVEQMAGMGQDKYDEWVAGAHHFAATQVDTETLRKKYKKLFE